MNDKLFDPATGEVFDGGGDRPSAPTTEDASAPCSRCEALHAELRQVATDLALEAQEARRLRRQVGALKAELEERRSNDQKRPIALAVFDYWVKATGRNPNRTKFGEKRQKALLKRLGEGYEEDYLKQAVDGLVLGAYVNPASGKRYDDIELMTRDETNLERFWEIAELAKKRHAAGRDTPPPEAPPWL